MREKKRLDLLILEQHPHLSRNQVQSFILQRKVRVNDLVIDKAGTLVLVGAKIDLDADQPKYVSRGGFKLEAALDYFKIDVSNVVALDSGISTGGFTDCLLQRGVKRVYGIDVGLGQVHEKIRKDSRLILYEKTNLRLLERLPELVDLVTLDLSFISILKVLPAITKLMKPTGKIIALIKPQFEAEREDIRRGGVVKDDKVHQRVLQKIMDGMKEFSFKCVGIIDSPIVGATSGNKEFLGLFERV